MFSSKKVLNVLKQTRCISVLSQNPVGFNNFPSYSRTRIPYESCPSVCALDFKIAQFFRNYAKGKDKKKEKGIYDQIQTFSLVLFPR